MAVLKRLTLVSGIIFLLLACSPSGSEFDVSITGAVRRDFSGAAIYYEGTPTGRQIYIEKTGPNQDIQVLTLEMPPDVEPGTYTITSSGPVSAAYFEFVDGVSSQFERSVDGTVNITEADDEFSGELDFHALAPASRESVQIVGKFNSIPFSTGGGSASSITSAALIFALVSLILINFVLQFYVGAKVYASEGMGILEALRGTRTYIRGWQMPELRGVMLIWSALLVLILLVFVILGVMAASTVG